MKIDIGKILIVPTRSRYELEVERSSKEEARKKFGDNGVWEHICEGHKTQKENLKKVSNIIGKQKIIFRELLSEENIKNKSRKNKQKKEQITSIINNYKKQNYNQQYNQNRKIDIKQLKK